MAAAPHVLWDGSLHYNDPKFIEVSCQMPQQIFGNNRNDNILKFRQLGSRDLKEAIIYIPGIYESDASFYRMAPLLKNEGYRVIVLNTGNHNTFESLLMTFDQFLRYLKLSAIHLIGCDFGGFVALQLQNSENLTAQIKSLTLINSYTQNTMFVPREMTGFSVLGYLVARRTLNQELEACQMTLNPKSATKFILQELETIELKELGKKIELRMAVTMPLYLRVPVTAMMSIEPLDREMSSTAPFLPSMTINGVKQALMKTGGDWPQLSAPEDLFSYVLVHIRKHWGANEETNTEQKAK